MNNTEKLMAIQLQKKSLAIGLLLTIFFGGFGVLYASTSIIGIVAAIIEIPLIFLCFTGIGLLLVLPVHVIFLIFTAVLISRHNKKIFGSLTDNESQ